VYFIVFLFSLQSCDMVCYVVTSFELWAISHQLHRQWVAEYAAVHYWFICSLLIIAVRCAGEATQSALWF